MNVFRILIVFLMLLAPQSWASSEIESDIESALMKLETGITLLEQRAPDADGVIREAAADLQDVIDEQQLTTPGAYHALGNAYSLLGEHGHAVLAYKRGERISPTDPKLQDSLKRARGQVQISVEPDTFHRVTGWLMSWRGFVPRNLLWSTFIGFFILSWLLMSARVAFGAPRWFVTLGLWLIGTSLIPFTALGAEWMLYQGDKDVVITQEGIMARSGPDDSIYELVYTEPLSAGVEGKLVEQRDDWAQLELANGTSCWVPQQSFERVAGTGS